MTRIVRATRGPAGPRPAVVAQCTLQGGSTATDATEPFFSLLGGVPSLQLRASTLKARAKDAADADTVFPLKIGDTMVGDFTFPAGLLDAVITYTHGDLVDGERLDLYGSATPNPTLRSIVFSFGEAPH